MPALVSLNDIYRVRTSPKKLVMRALRLIGAIDAGEEIESQELEDGIEALNAMVDSWNTEELMIYSLAKNELTLTASQDSHTIGPSGDLDVPRPNSIEAGQAYVSGGSLGSVVRELEVLNQRQWQTLAAAGEESIPAALYYDPSVPLGVLWLSPTPSEAFTFILYAWQMLQQTLTADANTELALAPGYADALAFNLALRIAPEYGKEASGLVVAGAIESKASIKRMNRKPVYAAMPVELMTSGQFDIVTGGFR